MFNPFYLIFGFRFFSWWTSLLCIVKELGGGGAIDVAVGIGGWRQVTGDRCQVTGDTSNVTADKDKKS